MTEILADEIKPTHSLYDDDAVRAIGELFLNCASSEAALMFTLNELASYPYPATLNGMALITGMQNKVILEKISAAIAMIAPAEHDELDGVCTRFWAIFEHRNNVAHSSAIFGQGKRIVVYPLKLRPPFQSKKITYTPTQLREYGSKLLNHVRHLTERLRQLGLKRSAELSLPKPLGLAGQQPPDHQPKP